MPLEAGLIGYAGLATLALAVKKHRPTPPLPIMPSVRTARLAGWGLLALALMMAALRFGATQGIVAWTGQICVAGALLVLLLSWRPRLALMLGVPALSLAFLLIAMK